MSESPEQGAETAPEQQPTTDEPTATPEQPQKPTETVDFWKQKAREQEKRAKDNADAAKRLAEYENAQKTEAQRSADALAAAETRASEAESRVSALSIATEFHLGSDDAELVAALADESAQRKLAERLAEQAAQQQASVGFRVDHSNTTTSDTPDKDAVARSVFGI